MVCFNSRDPAGRDQMLTAGYTIIFCFNSRDPAGRDNEPSR